ncbi:MAG TPA: RNA polymerase sigma factor [Thermoanaerobaculia bacterium]|nr:RNA polymerase sigma factor [Thermoanaerobaculia bacterium]
MSRPVPNLTTTPPPRGSEDDLRLARACAGGDSDVFASIYDRHGERMKSIAYHQLGNVADAEDAVQETFIKLHRAAAGYNGEAAFTTWLYRILINTCYDMLRRRSRRIRETPIDDLLHAGHAANAVDDVKRMALRKLLSDLPEQRRTVFALFEIEGLSHAEIAAILDISEGNSKWILFSTKKQLQEQWKK